MRDFRYALRVLRRSPGFTAIAILSLALGIGANTAIFSVSWVLFSQPLAVQNPDGLMAITNRLTIPRDLRGMSQINGSSYRDPASGRSYRYNFSFPAYLALRDAAGDAADVFAYSFVREANIALEGWSTTGAAALFGSESPLGRRQRLFNVVDVEVAGVVRDTKYDSVRKTPVPTLFLPYMQSAGPLKLGAMYVVVRTAVAPAALTSALRGVVADIDRDVPVSRMKTQTEQIQETLGTERAFTRLLIAFGAFALFLGCIGLHGLTAYSVARRTSEIGLRVALGAQRRDVLWLILRQAVMVTAVGLAAGIPITIAGGKAVASLLYGVKPVDPASLAVSTVVMMGRAARAARPGAPAHTRPIRLLRTLRSES